MYLVKEKDIISWAKSNNIKFINCACRFTEMCNIEDDNTSKRKEMKKLIEEMRKTNKNIDFNIFKALDNINLNCVLRYKKDGVEHSFLDDYDK